MTTIKEIEKQMSFHHEKLNELHGQLIARNPTRQFYCLCCKQASQIKNVSLVEEMHYVDAYGCTGGAYWQHSEYKIVCPKCGVATRAYSSKHDSEMNERYRFVDKYRSYFKEHLKWYPTRDNFLNTPKFNLDVIRNHHFKMQSR